MTGLPAVSSVSLAAAVVGVAVLGAMLFVLGFNVSRLRGVTAKVGGSQMPTDPASPLLIAQRAHGNASEYVAYLAVLFLVVGFGSPAWVAVPLVAGATLARLLHAYGMLSARSLAQHRPASMAGAVGTYLFGVALAVAAVFTLW
ncbi:MAPEG family protein [Pseudonocardia sp.]|uniref:MAPEG family protein n=1 Tax=Pseudonocardia sp. TaxID=60912 RepID=UPI002637402E|nr:MAPEG family protein [Pseudonocardia sp.]